MLPANAATRIQRRFLHSPANCRAGCGACLGALLSPRGRKARRLLLGAATVLVVAVGALGLPPGQHAQTWREQAAALAALLSDGEYSQDRAAAALRTDLTLLGYQAEARQPPPDEDESSGSDDENADDENADDPGSDEEPDTDQDGTDEEADGDSATDEDATDEDATDEDGASDEDAADDQDATDQDATDEDAADEDGATSSTSAPNSDSDEAPPTGQDGPDDEESSSSAPDGAGPGGGGGDVLWSADGTDLSEFEGGGDSQQDGSPPPEVVDDPVRSGEQAVSFTIPGGGQRNEVLPGLDFSEGDERWFGFSTLLEEGFPTDAGWSVIMQWKNDGTGSPPLSLAVQDGEYQLDGGFGHPDGAQTWTEPLGEPEIGQWTDWVIHVVFSDGADALVEVWRDGEPVLTGFSPDAGTLYPGLDSYLKIGYYRDTGIGDPGTVLHSNWVVGTTRAAVDPAGEDTDPSGAGPTSAEGDAEDWETVAGDLAELLVDVEDPAARELAEVLADAGFDAPSGSTDTPSSTDAPSTTDAIPTTDEMELSAARGGGG